MTFPPVDPWPPAQSWGTPQPMPGYPPPLPPGPPPRSRSRLIITVIAVAFVALLLIVALVLWLFGGSDEERLVKESALTGVLLTKPEAGTILGTGPLEPDADYGGDVESTWDTSEPDACNFVLAAEREHADSGSTAVRRQNLRSTDADVDKGKDFGLTQAVVAFPDADAAQKFVETTKSKWQQCAGKTFQVAMTSGTPPTTDNWRNGDVSDTDDIVSWSITKLGSDADGWTCHDGLTARDNVVVEVGLCDAEADPEFLAPLVSKISEKIDKAAQAQRSSHRHFRFFHHRKHSGGRSHQPVDDVLGLLESEARLVAEQFDGGDLVTLQRQLAHHRAGRQLTRLTDGITGHRRHRPARSRGCPFQERDPAFQVLDAAPQIVVGASEQCHRASVARDMGTLTVSGGCGRPCTASCCWCAREKPAQPARCWAHRASA
jgi:hypothetical protein